MRACLLAFGVSLWLSCCGWNPKAYTVRSGDTLYLIAWRYNLTPEQIAEWNNLDNPDLIYPGQKLLLAPSKTRRGASAKPEKQSRKIARHTKFDGLRSEKWHWPTEAGRDGEVIENFAWDGKQGRKGISIAGDEDLAVLASRGGEVVYVGDDISGYGNMVILQHDEIHLSAYGHNKKITVKEGDKIKRGEKIALMGQTDTNRVKLYFEIRRDSVPVDPLSVLP